MPNYCKTCKDKPVRMVVDYTQPPTRYPENDHIGFNWLFDLIPSDDGQCTDCHRYKEKLTRDMKRQNEFHNRVQKTKLAFPNTMIGGKHGQ